MRVTVCLAGPADARDMAEIHMRSWEAAYAGILPAEYIEKKNKDRPALWERVLAEGNTTRHIILADGRAAGLLCLGPPEEDDAGGDAYELYAIYLHPDFYRQGVGTQALAFAFDKARGLGKREMTVWVFSENANAIAFYRACGFAPDGKTAVGEYGRPIESMRMRRTL